jgi:serine/threonine-protein kinase
MIRQRYRVERVLGRGGMGEVLLAHDTLLHRHVALKRLRSGDDADDRPRSAILKEARRASQVTAPGIAAIYDVLEEQNDVLIVMEYVEGETLRSRTTTPVSLSEFRDIAAQSLAAVGAAHARGIVHRDLKPDNLMRTPEGRIKILDFGIARRPDAPEGTAPSASTITTLTAEEEGVISGTPQYMAPEAYYSGRIDQRTDLFSLGTVFYELLTAVNPFRAPTFYGVRERVMTHAPRPASELNAEVTPALAAVLARMMAKDPAQRQASCAAVQREIDAAIDGTGEIAVSPSSVTTLPRRGTRQALRVAALLGVLVAAAVVGWWALEWAPAHALPADRNLAVLSPMTPGASEDFVHFALGATDQLSQRLQKHQTEPGFQIASFVEGMDEHVQSAADAHKFLGATLALIPTVEQRADVYRARLSLWNTARASVIATREFETPTAQPFEFLDRLYRESAGMLELSARRTDAASELGVRGAGTLTFMLQGIGRMRAAATVTEAEKAVEDLELARRTEPEANVALAWLSAAQRKCFTLGSDRQWLDQAVASARQATARDSTRAEGFRYLGLALLGEKDDAGAIAAFARACTLNPTDDDSYSRLGSALGRTGQRDAELATYRSVVARRPHCWQPYWWMANAYYRRGQVVESIHAYREMVRHAPDFYKGYSNLGGLLVLNGAYSPAIDTLKRSIALLPTKTAFDNLGTAYFNSGRIPEAIAAYNQAFQGGFAEYDSWINLGDAYYFLRGRRDQAAGAYTQAIRLGRERAASRAQAGRAFDVMVPANLSTVFPKIAQPDSASVYLGQALAIDSSNVMVQYCAALTCWQLSQPDQAIRWLNKAVEGGYPVAWLRDSPVFRGWQTQPGFRAILERSKAQSASSSSPD